MSSDQATFNNAKEKAANTEAQLENVCQQVVLYLIAEAITLVQQQCFSRCPPVSFSINQSFCLDFENIFL
jgi:hypothetical protein